MKMLPLFYYIALLLTILTNAVNCNHEDHYNHQYDWTLIVSKLEFLWKNKTDAPTTVTTEHAESHDKKDDISPNDEKGHHWGSHDVTSTTELPITPVLQNGTFVENVKETFRASLALLVGVPIFGILVLCCFCYCCCKCCAACCCEDSEEGKVIVVQQNNAPPVSQPPPQHTQVILQQPVYQTPVYTMQPPPPQYGPAPQQPPQYGQAPPQQWAAPPPHHHPAAYDNPDYDGAPSAPPPQYGKY